MKYLGCILLILLLVDVCFLQASEEKNLAIFENLFAEHELNSQDFKETIKKAREVGISEQLLLESDIFYHLLHSTESGVWLPLLERLERKQAHWDSTQGHFVDSLQKLCAVKAALRARQDFFSGDIVGFEVGVKEAFWLEPELGPLLSRWITDYRLKENVRAKESLMKQEMTTFEGKKVTLARLVKGKKVLLLCFWASWCPERLPPWDKWMKVLEPQGVKMVAVNTECIQDEGAKAIFSPCLLEPEESPLSSAFDIQSIPCLVLLGRKGEFLFKGNWDDPDLVEVLAERGIVFSGKEAVDQGERTPST